jgi:serine/threonine protein kinase
MFQLITGVKYIHAKGMMHRDLKPQNILVSDKGTKIKIADFGLGRNVHFPLQTYSK